MEVIDLLFIDTGHRNYTVESVTFVVDTTLWFEHR
jgi:hypothetical protein